MGKKSVVTMALVLNRHQTISKTVKTNVPGLRFNIKIFVLGMNSKDKATVRLYSYLYKHDLPIYDV